MIGIKRDRENLEGMARCWQQADPNGTVNIGPLIPNLREDPITANPLSHYSLSMEQTDQGPTHTEIAALAEKIYLESGSITGQDEQNWLKAEAQLRQGNSKPNNEPAAGRPKAKQSSPRQSQASTPRAMAATR
jgi:hypothetical protein